MPRSKKISAAKFGGVSPIPEERKSVIDKQVVQTQNENVSTPTNSEIGDDSVPKHSDTLDSTNSMSSSIVNMREAVRQFEQEKIHDTPSLSTTIDPNEQKSNSPSTVQDGQVDEILSTTIGNASSSIYSEGTPVRGLENDVVEENYQDDSTKHDSSQLSKSNTAIYSVTVVPANSSLKLALKRNVNVPVADHILDSRKSDVSGVVVETSNNSDKIPNQQQKVLDNSADSENMVTDKENEPVIDDSQKKKSQTKKIRNELTSLQKKETECFLDRHF